MSANNHLLAAVTVAFNSDGTAVPAPPPVKMRGTILDSAPGSNLDDDPYEEAAKLGLAPFVPPSNVLAVDLDSEAALQLFHDRLEKLRQEWNKYRQPPFDIATYMTVSKSGNHHGYVALQFCCTIPEAIALQQYLGSDPTRESLSLLRHLFNTGRPPIVLFETKGEVESSVRNWLQLFARIE